MMISNLLLLNHKQKQLQWRKLKRKVS